MVILVNNRIKFKSIHWHDTEFHNKKTYFEQICYFPNLTFCYLNPVSPKLPFCQYCKNKNMRLPIHAHNDSEDSG